jgi:hypothetical protein
VLLSSRPDQVARGRAGASDGGVREVVSRGGGAGIGGSGSGCRWGVVGSSSWYSRGEVTTGADGAEPAVPHGYLLARILIPFLLILLAARGANPTQKIGRVRDYLTGGNSGPSRPQTADDQCERAHHYPGFSSIIPANTGRQVLCRRGPVDHEGGGLAIDVSVYARGGHADGAMSMAAADV